jgi:type II secretory pathway pseudopilin PulG
VKKQAFTILELLIALTLFIFGMLSLLQIFPANRKLLTQTSQTTQATFLAQEQLEVLKDDAFSSITPGTYLARAVVTADTTSPFNQFEREVVVDYINPTTFATSGSATAVKRITATIYWSENGVSRSYSLSTYATQD